jgi:NADP-dependent aldehyde dehydrogenase
VTDFFPDATDTEIKASVFNAKRCFNKYRKLDGTVRANFLREIKKELRNEQNKIISIAQSETKLGKQRLEMELHRTIGEIELFANMAEKGKWLKTTFREQNKKTLKSSLHTENIPIGPVLVIGACNFPIAISVVGTDTISALAVGCPVIVKAHPGHPRTCQLLATIVLIAQQNSQIPKGTFQLIHGKKYEVTQKLVVHPDISCIAFTGSLAGGKGLSEIVFKRKIPIPFHAEMGSINPIIVLPGKIFENHHKLANDYIQAVTLFSGQMCTKPGVVFLLKSKKNGPFIKDLQEAVINQKVLPMLNQEVFNNYENCINWLKKELTLIATNESDKGEIENAGFCRIFEADSKQFLLRPELRIEAFGPASLLVHCEDEEELFNCINSLEGTLTASIHATEQDNPLAKDIVVKLESIAGRLLWNGFPPGVIPGIATHHGGPWPATTDSRHTSIGKEAYRRFVRPVCKQGFPTQKA